MDLIERSVIMDNKIERELWEEAVNRAKTLYEEEFGASWEDADKCEREDWVWAEFEAIKAKYERNNNNETTNKNSNKRGNDIMMNKNTERMEKLAQAGIDTTNFFNLNLQIPFGAEVKLVVDGKEMIVPATNEIGTSTPVAFTTPVIIDGASLLNDSIAKSIINDGYVKNSKLFRRFVFAQTMKLINYQSWKNPNRKGWEAGFKDLYSYQYQFEMMADELHTLAKLQKEDPEYFAERTMFFNGDVVVALLNDYLYRLKKYVKKQMRENPRKYRGQEYVKLAKYGNVLVKDLDDKVYIPIQERINVIESMVKAENYSYVEREFKIFMDKFYNKLPYETTKCAVFKDAFKGIGGFESLKNGIRFHGLILRGCTNKYDSERKLYELLNGEYKNEVWRFHNLLVETITYNNFDLRKSIAEGNKATGTKSDKALKYKR
jgi:hypothetical protein